MPAPSGAVAGQRLRSAVITLVADRQTSRSKHGSPVRCSIHGLTAQPSRTQTQFHAPRGSVFSSTSSVCAFCSVIQTLVHPARSQEFVLVTPQLAAPALPPPAYPLDAAARHTMESHRQSLRCGARHAQHWSTSVLGGMPQARCAVSAPAITPDKRSSVSSPA